MRDDFDDCSSDEGSSYRDCRVNEMLALGSEPSVDISTQLIKEKIHRIHCQQLQRATNGRLTWQGDQIVSTTMRLRERECAVATIRKQIELLEAKAQCEPSAKHSGSPQNGQGQHSQCLRESALDSISNPVIVQTETRRQMAKISIQ